MPDMGEGASDPNSAAASCAETASGGGARADPVRSIADYGHALQQRWLGLLTEYPASYG